MTLIKKANELNIQTKIKALIYGQAGVSKTTLALSAPKPLLLDFDGGVSRVNYTHLQGVDTVQVTKWQDVNEVLKEDLSAYETIVVDTIGKMMDFIITFKCGIKVPRIQDWSGINAEFSSFIRTVSNLNKHVIFIAHRDVRKEGDDNVFVPTLREKNYSSIVTELDLLGYVEMKDKERTITFDPTSRNEGKNTCNLPGIMRIPTILDESGKPIRENDFFVKNIINVFEARLSERALDGQKYNQLIEELENQILLITDESSINDFVSRIDNFEHIGNSKAVAGKKLNEKAKELGLTFNKESKKYEKINQPQNSLL